jgi:hypothetical protein
VASLSASGMDTLASVCESLLLSAPDSSVTFESFRVLVRTSLACGPRVGPRALAAALGAAREEGDEDMQADITTGGYPKCRTG